MTESRADGGASRELTLAFAPLHKRAFGMACGIVSGLFFFLLTAVYLLRQPAQGPNLSLLAEYFAGYTVSWAGALVALAWGFVVGFVAGWFTAFSRNLIIAASLFITRTRAELRATRDFLDHI
jgi:membrane protease YdiL (CAAX protease family)